MNHAAPPAVGPRIALLDAAVANQIAAGEVVERPASIVKELVENALDAGATRITIRLDDGGKRLVRVTDNGSGMGPQDARLAFARHATSKLRSADDLLDIASFGFRGEALASILAVAKVTLTTRRAADDVGIRLCGAGGVDLAEEPAGCAPGTDIQVEDLFFNVPARLKFLRTGSTETGRILDLVETLALARPDLHLTLWAANKKVLDFTPDNDASARASAVLGPQVARRLFAVQGQGEYGVTALLSEPALNHVGPGQLRILVNGRPVSDRTLQQAVAQAYGTLLERGRYPVGVLWIDCPAGTVDVNVHPAKSEVRFAAQGNVFGSVVRAIGAMLAETPWIRTQLPSTRAVVDAPSAQRWERSVPLEASQAALIKTDWSAAPTPTVVEAAAPGPQRLATPEPQLLPIGGPAAGQWAALRYVGQVGNCYLVCQDERAMVVIDQHAAHERVLFERFVVGLRAGALPSQVLLIPLAVPLAPAEVVALTEETELLARLGFEVAAGGPRLVRVLAQPLLLRDKDVAPHVRQLAASLLAGGRDGALVDRLERHAATLACHSAFRAGDVLHAADVHALLGEMDGVDLSAYCPHGRPVWTRVPLGDIARWFGRP